MAASRQTRQRAISKTKDPATHYAQKVVRGDIVAGPHVRDACKRHLDDLQHGAARGLVWDLEGAMRAIGFCRDVLCLNGGKFEGAPFILELWQAFIMGSLFGWKNTDGTRRFRVAYVETGKGSGKSPLAAAVGLYGLTCDGEERAEVYAAATKKDQAQILFRDAVAMVDQSPELAKRLVKSGSPGKEWNLAYHETNSFFRPIAADDGQSGPRPHIALLDEVHEHKSGHVVEMLRAGFKFRSQPMMFMITNSGSSRQSVCWEYHQYGAEVSAAARVDDTFFAYICALDESDDPFTNRDCWAKANPSIGVTIQPKYLEEQITQARGMPSKESIVKRLNFCMWVESASPWISYHVWKAAEEPVPDEVLYGRRCYAGLDLSSTQDLTASVFAFEPTDEDPVWRLKSYFWLPGEGLYEKSETDRVPYIKWRDDGHLMVTPGRAISKLVVLRQLVELCGKFDVQCIAYDRWRIEDLKMLIEDEGLSLPQLIEFGQGFKDMAPALDQFETLLLGTESAGNLKHDGNPVMTWCAANAVTAEDPAGNRKIAKDKATGRVDGIVAAIMAVGRAAMEPPKAKSFWEAA